MSTQRALLGLPVSVTGGHLIYVVFERGRANDRGHQTGGERLTSAV